MKEKCYQLGNTDGICLYEQGSVVQSLFSYEEKIIDALDRLIELLSMTENRTRKRSFKRNSYIIGNSASDLQRADVY